MSKNLATVRRLSIAVLAASLIACSTAQGATSGSAGVQREEQSGDVHITEYEYGPNGTHSMPLQTNGGAAGELGFGPALVP